jgi:hypothetical protein
VKGNLTKRFFMEWYYAIDGVRREPVSAQEMARLVAAGDVRDDTLVWRAGMGVWQPWSEVAAGAGLPALDGVGSQGMSAGGGGVAAASELTLSPDEFWAGVQQHGYRTSVGSCLSRGFDLYKGAIGGCLAGAWVPQLVTMAAGLVPLVSFVATFLVTPQMNAGMLWSFVRRVRGEPAEIGDVFEGYRRAFGRLALVMLLQLLVLLPFIVGAVVAGGGLAILAQPQVEGTPPEVPWGGVFAVLTLGLLGGAVAIRFLLAPILILDRGYSAGEAMKLSWRLLGRRFWTLVALLVALALVQVAGLLALVIGFVFTLPMYGAALAYLYEDACRAARGAPPAV